MRYSKHHQFVAGVHLNTSSAFDGNPARTVAVHREQARVVGEKMFALYKMTKFLGGRPERVKYSTEVRTDHSDGGQLT